MKSLLALSGALALCCAPLPAEAATYQTARHLNADSAQAVRMMQARSTIRYFRAKTWHWQDARGARRAETFHLERRVASLPRLARLGGFWRGLAARNRVLTVAWREAQREARQLYSGGTAGAICAVFGAYCSQALAVARCESGLSVYATNGQYLGLFQMGDYARGRYGHASDAYGQARAAFAYFRDSGYSWSAWECKP